MAGITISTLFGDNGIISAARKAADDTKTAENDTEKGVSNLEKDINEQVYGIVEPKNIKDWIYEKDETTNTITILRYKGPDKEVVIPNYIGGVKVKNIGTKQDGLYYYDSLWDSSICASTTNETYGYPQEDITKVLISEGIENINTCCFGNTKNLKEVVIPNSITNIGNYTFTDCSSLTNITIPNSVTSIGGFAFGNCSSLTNITIPSSVTTMGYSMFAGIPSITVTVPFREVNKPSGWDTNWNYTGSGTVNIIYKQ